MGSLEEEDWISRVEKIIDEHQIDTNSTRPVEISSLKSSTHVFEVTRPDLKTNKTFIIETESGNKIIARPSLVGSELSEECTDAAVEAVKAMFSLTEIKDFPQNAIAFYAILRAGPYYARHTAFNIITNGKVSTVAARPRYTTPSYLNHTGERRVEVMEGSVDFKKLPSGKELYIITDDTGASGKTFKVAIPTLIEECEKAGSSVKVLDVYGFLSCISVKILKDMEKEFGIKVNLFCIGGITDLAPNNYDMPFYGFRNRGDNGRGSVIDKSTLLRLVPQYPPLIDLDPVGDWSARFIDIESHVRHTIDRIKSVMDNSDGWEVESAKSELERLELALRKHGK
jgi:hypothetical protein